MIISLIEGLQKTIFKLAKDAGASHIGTADVSEVYNIWPDSFKESGELFTGISICVPEDDILLDNLPQTDDKCRTVHYTEKIKLALEIGDRISDLLEDNGYQTCRLSHPPIHKPTGLYKLVARYAGVGWIGKNRLLITPDYGPRVALAAVLTDAPLEPTSDKPMESQCKDCVDCIDACPVKAYSDELFGDTDSMDGFNTGRCAVNRGVINPTGWGVCGLCVRACPFGTAVKRET